jgi:hypothetical protein
MSSEAGIAVVRRNTEEVQSRGNFEVFEEPSPPISSIIRPSRAASPRIATAREIYIAHCAPHFLIFTRRSIGKFPTAIA